MAQNGFAEWTSLQVVNKDKVAATKHSEITNILNNSHKAKPCNLVDEVIALSSVNCGSAGNETEESMKKQANNNAFANASYSDTVVSNQDGVNNKINGFRIKNVQKDQFDYPNIKMATEDMLDNPTNNGTGLNEKRMNALNFNTTNKSNENANLALVNKGIIDTKVSKQVIKNEKDVEDNEMDKLDNRTELQNFYHGKNVFITGGTGFLGKMLVEKLLRSAPGVDNLYLLVREKKGKDVFTRIEEIFDDPVFSRLKREVPKFRHKIVTISGDCSAEDLGLRLTDQQLLKEKVDVIFHVAATVKFDEHLRAALATNVRAPLHLLRLAGEMQHLQALVHVSTAYSNCHLSRIEEKVYNFPVDHDTLQKMVDGMNDSEIDRMLPKILGSWPNTYTFTKAMAENELKKNCRNLPLAVFRPAIVTSTAKEPIPSWIDNMYGPTGVVAGAATGVLRTVQCDPAVTADIVPVDSVVNCLIAAARHAAHNDRTQHSEPPVFNYVSSVENRITWGDFMLLNCKYGFTHPLSSAIWYICITLNRSSCMNSICKIFLHFLPALVVDALAVCVGQKPKLLKVYRKIHKFSSVLSYFCTHDIHFCNENVRRLWNETSEADKQLYPFSMQRIDWVEYFSGYISGIRTHLFKETDDTLEQARTKWNRLYYLHQLVKSLFISALLFFSWTVLNFVVCRVTC